MVFKEQLCHFQSHLLPNFSMWADIELEWGSCFYILNRFEETKRWCANCAHSTATATPEQRTKKKQQIQTRNGKQQTTKWNFICSAHIMPNSHNWSYCSYAGRHVTSKESQSILGPHFISNAVVEIVRVVVSQKSETPETYEAKALLKFQNSRAHYIDYLGLRSNNRNLTTNKATCAVRRTSQYNEIKKWPHLHSLDPQRQTS